MLALLEALGQMGITADGGNARVVVYSSLDCLSSAINEWVLRIRQRHALKAGKFELDHQES